MESVYALLRISTDCLLDVSQLITQAFMPSRNRFAGNGASKRIPVLASQTPAKPLTPREEEVASWIGMGKSNSEIASILGCSPRTVETHVHNILKKLNFETRNHICAWRHERRQSLALLARKRAR